jgi:Holliday junction resolvasome RuvABC endonuclease subunit
MTKTLTLLGIDPSLSNTGYAVADVDLETRKIVRVHKVGLFETKPGQEGKKVRKSSEDVARARVAAKGMQALISKYGIKVATGEVPSGAQSARGALSNGVCIGLMASLPIPMYEVSPTEVKMASVGNKVADKEDVVRWAVELAGPDQEWPVGPKNDWGIVYGPKGKCVVKKAEHPADALAAIAACIATEQFAQAAGMILSLA